MAPRGSFHPRSTGRDLSLAGLTAIVFPKLELSLILNKHNTGFVVDTEDRAVTEVVIYGFPQPAKSRRRHSGGRRIINQRWGITNREEKWF